MAAALALADDRGDFSMRGLGQKLRVDPMAIYRHYRDKEAVLDAMVDAALGGLTAPSAELGPPRARLERMCADFYEALLAHPGVAGRVATTRPVLGPHTLGLTEGCIAILVEMGLAPREAVQTFATLVRHIAGVVAAEQTIRASGLSEAEWSEEMRSAYAALPRERFPRLTEIADVFGEVGLREQFQFGLGLLIEAIERRSGADG